MIAKNRFLFLLLFYCGYTFGQLHTYNHKRELKGISDQWHKISVPNEVFDKVSGGLSDIRIYGVTENDTLESPYIWQIAKGKNSKKEIGFKLMNSASAQNGYFYTYEIPTSEPINMIHLDVGNKNFDWRVKLEGSQNQREWFTILDDYRILSINNGQTDYKFTDLDFPDAKYRYYRILIKADAIPKLNSAKISIDDKVDAKYRTYPITYTNISEKKEHKETVINIDLNRRVPVSLLKINVTDKIDYYRPVRIEYISDSVETEKGWKYSYRNLGSGILNSVEPNEFTFGSTLAQKLRITVRNHDNQPLTVESVEAKGYVHELVARFTEPATYYLAYGNTNTTKPQYDIPRVLSKIPENLSELTVGKEQDIPKKESQTVAPLFENKIWLWMVMGIVILVLGGFTLRMMRKK